MAIPVGTIFRFFRQNELFVFKFNNIQTIKILMQDREKWTEDQLQEYSSLVRWKHSTCYISSKVWLLLLPCNEGTSILYSISLPPFLAYIYIVYTLWTGLLTGSFIFTYWVIRRPRLTFTVPDLETGTTENTVAGVTYWTIRFTCNKGSC